MESPFASNDRKTILDFPLTSLRSPKSDRLLDNGPGWCYHRDVSSGSIRIPNFRVKIPANQLSSSVQKSLLPCYLVTGDEPLLVQEALDVIRNAARQMGFGARELHISGQGFDWAELAGSGAMMSLFAEKRIIELRLPSGKPGRQGGAAIVDLLNNAGDELLILISAPKLDRSAAASKWAKAVESRGALVQVWPIGLRELPSWIAGRMQKAGLKPDRNAVRLIADRVEGNLLAADQEIEKLRLLLGAGTVSVEDVNEAVANSSRYDVYKLADTAVGGEPSRALRVLDGVRAEGVDATLVIWVLTRELRVLGRLANMVQSGAELGSALQKSGVWRSRHGIVRSCVARHRAADFYSLLKVARRADAAAKGQSGEDAWQLATDIVLGVAMGSAKAA
jgi:DNA polymerase-3 subunit delta